jgi:hypothetical protein
LKRLIFLVALMALVAGMATTPDTAKAERLGKFGIEGGFGGSLDWYLGARAELGASKLSKNSRTVVNFDWFFPEGDGNKYYEFDFNYLFPLRTLDESKNSQLYIGAGLNIGRGWNSDVKDSENWGFGMNALGGLKFDLGNREAFVEGGYTFFSDYDQWHVGGGFLF